MMATRGERRFTTGLRILLLVVALIPPAALIIWGELSEFNLNFWLLPIVNVSQTVLYFEDVLIASFYLITPTLLLLFLRGVSAFRENRRFLVMVFCCIASFGILRYLEYFYDTNGPPAVNPFGNFYPLAFWALPLLMSAAFAVVLSTKS
ncbi:MAG TPA: hypothetical protein VED17_06200 [Nitrososphaerales archaeon]|nr:hypothetical protein [Nitrososphaerales archaeon]